VRHERVESFEMDENGELNDDSMWILTWLMINESNMLVGLMALTISDKY